MSSAARHRYAVPLLWAMFLLFPTLSGAEEGGAPYLPPQDTTSGPHQVDPARVDSLMTRLRPGDLVWIEQARGDAVEALVLTRSEERVVPIAGERGELVDRIELYQALLRDPGRAAEGPLRQVVDETAALRLGEILLGPCRDLLEANPGLIVVPAGVTRGLPWSTLRLRLGPEPNAPARDLLQLVRSISERSLDRCLHDLGPRGGEVGAIGYEPAPRVLMEERCAASRAYRSIDVMPARADLQRLLKRRHYDLLQLEVTPQLKLELPYLQFDLWGEPPRLVLLCQPHATTTHDATALGDALLQAGASTVVTNLWPVDSWVESRLLARFYEALADGETAGAALRTAQQFLHQDDATRSPALWGGFSILGDSEVTVVLARRYPEAWARGALGLTAVLFLALLWSLRRRKDKP